MSISWLLSTRKTWTYLSMDQVLQRTINKMKIREQLSCEGRLRELGLFNLESRRFNVHKRRKQGSKENRLYPVVPSDRCWANTETQEVLSECQKTFLRCGGD